MSKNSKTLIEPKKKIALVAHDNMKQNMIEWAKFNKEKLKQHEIYATGTTGKLLEDELGIPIKKFLSGPLGGDQQIGAAIVEGKINFLIFFWDPLEQQPHDPDVKALLRIAVLWNIPVASNRSSADFLFSSILMDKPYERKILDFEDYLNPIGFKVERKTNFLFDHLRLITLINLISLIKHAISPISFKRIFS